MIIRNHKSKALRTALACGASAIVVRGLGRGVASLEILAVNEGSARPNTAQIKVDNVVRGEGTQTYSLATGETATLRIEASANASAPGMGQ